MAINRERMLDIAGLEQRMGGLSNLGNFNFLGGGLPPANIANILQQQGPVLGPDDFGSYVIPASDPTYRTGFDYARSIAGGIPMEQVIAPGVSYSPEQLMGYTQAQLNTPVGTTPVEPPPPPPEKLPAPDDPSFLGTGIGGVTIFDDVFDKKRMPPLRDIFGGTRDIRDVPPLGGLMNIGKLFGGGIDKDAIDKIVQERITESMPIIEQPDFSQFVRREDIPTLIPDVPTGRDFSIEDIRRDLDLPDFSQFARQQDIPTIPTFEQPDLSSFVRQEDIPSLITRVPNGSDFSIDREALIRDIREGINIPTPQLPDVSKFVTQEDINRAIAGIDIPTYQTPDLSGLDTRLADLERGLLSLQEPTGGRFSVQQQRPMGLFA